MTIDPAEIERRSQLARTAIQAKFGAEGDEHGVTLFVSHHLEELDSSYWEKQFKTPSPEPSVILEALVLIEEFEDEEDLDMLDFTLPGEVTDYVISVQFDESGAIEAITMES